MNAQEIYKEALGIGTSEDEIKYRQQQAEQEQRNVEAWAQWRQLPQTGIFIDKLNTVSRIINKITAAYCANVPGVSNDYVRARMVESNLLNEIIDITVSNGQLKENLIKEYIV